MSIPASFTIFVVPCSFFNVTSTVFSFLSRISFTFTLSPGRCLASASCKSAILDTFLLSTPIITSSTLISAPAAEPPSTISETQTPSTTPSALALSAKVVPDLSIGCLSSIKLLPIDPPRIPSKARCTVPYCFRSAITFVIMLVGIANPYPA